MTEHDKLAEFKNILSERQLKWCRATAAQEIIETQNKNDKTAIAYQVLNGRRDTHYVCARLIRNEARRVLLEQAQEMTIAQG